MVYMVNKIDLTSPLLSLRAGELICTKCGHLIKRDTLLLHAVPMANSDAMIGGGSKIVGKAERCSDLILAAVALANGT